MSVFEIEDREQFDMQREILASQAHLCEYMSQTLVLYREFFEKYPDSHCPEVMTLDNKFKVVLKRIEMA